MHAAITEWLLGPLKCEVLHILARYGGPQEFTEYVRGPLQEAPLVTYSSISYDLVDLLEPSFSPSFQGLVSFFGRSAQALIRKRFGLIPFGLSPFFKAYDGS